MRLRRAFVEVLKFEAVFKALTLFIIAPLLREIYQTYIASVGVAFNENMLGTFLTFKGALVFLALFFAAALLIFYEISAVINIVSLCRAERDFTLAGVMKGSVWNLGALRGKSALLAALYFVLLLPLVNTGYVNSVVPSVSIPEFIFGELRKTTLGQVGMVAIYALEYALYAALLFVPLFMVLRRERFGQAARSGLRAFKTLGLKGWVQIPFLLVVWTMATSEIARYWRRVRLKNSDFNGEFFTYLVYSEAFRKDLVFWLVMALLLTAGMTLFIYVLLANLEKRHGLCAALEAPRKGDAAAILHILARRARGLWTRLKNALRKARWRVFAGILGALAVVFIALGCWRPALVHAPFVIGHRGSAAQIENTLEAVRAAAEAGADYAEIDVQLTSDGVPVVFHDSSLTRLTGQSGSIAASTLAELQALTLRDAMAHPGMVSRIPTLDEAIAAAQESGAGLLIELKPDAGRGEALAAAVMEAVEAHDFAGQAIFMSLDYGCLTPILAAHPDWRVGYCVFGSSGDLDDSIWLYDIDFLAVEEGMVSNHLFSQARGYGLPVYIWSVLDDEKMLQYLEMGAGGLISDYPETARSVLEGYEAAHPGEAYLWAGEGYPQGDAFQT